MYNILYHESAMLVKWYHMWNTLVRACGLLAVNKTLESESESLWGTFAKPLAPRASSGIMRTVNQNKSWYRPTLAMRYTLNGNTVLGNIFAFKKGTATPMFNNSPSFYRNICSTYVQILGDLSVGTPRLCFSEIRKHVVQLKSLYFPTSFLTIKVNFDKIQFQGYWLIDWTSLFRHFWQVHSKR